MGPWASAIVAVASVVGLFFVVMAYRGLVEALQHYSGRCAGCHRMTMLPLPPQSHQCLRCHYRAVTFLHRHADLPH